MNSIIRGLHFSTCGVGLALCLAILGLVWVLTRVTVQASSRESQSTDKLAAPLMLAEGRLSNQPGSVSLHAPLAVPGDENWADGFILNGTNEEVETAAVDGNGNLFVGGWFKTAGGVVANNIAKWNVSTSTWESLGRGMSGGLYGPSVFALAFDGNGNLYAGGSFTTAGGVSANNIARWNASTNSWEALGSGTNSSVWALAADNSGNIYAGGIFTTAGGVSANCIAKWDVSTKSWSALGSGVSCGSAGPGGLYSVRALASDKSGNIFVGGNFANARNLAANGIAKWTGSNWETLGSGIDGCTGYISCAMALTVDGTGNLYMGGYFTSVSGVHASRIAKWNVSTNGWEALGSGIPVYGNNCYVGALAVYGNILYAGGYFPGSCGSSGPVQQFIGVWNGSSWSGLDSSVNNTVDALAVDKSGNLYAGGVFTEAGAKSGNRIARWDVSTNRWSALGTDVSVNSRIRALATIGSDVYVGGDYTWAGGVPATGVLKWNGSNWSAVGSGMNGNFSVLVRDTFGNLYACCGASGIARWNGTTWDVISPGPAFCIESLAVDANGILYAGGSSSPRCGHGNCIAKWNGTSWSALGSGIPCDCIKGDCWGSVYALAVDKSGNVYAGGNFTSAGGVPANYIARWNGNSWETLGSGMNGGVAALTVDANGDVYAGGGFTAAGGIAANSIARWDGSNWFALGSGMSGVVTALALDSVGNLYVGNGTNGIAKWNGSSWRPLGSGIDGPPSSIAIDNLGNLYAAGFFSMAGSRVSAYFARCTITPRVSDFFKLDDKNHPAFFTASDFANHFSEVDASTLTKIKMLSLPEHGTLKLGASNVSVNQEIAVADLNDLSFTPDTDWLGTTSFGWNGSDGTQYASSGASVTMTVAVLKYNYLPVLFR